MTIIFQVYLEFQKFFQILHVLGEELSYCHAAGLISGKQEDRE